MTQKELSQLEIRINVRVLWSIVLAVAIGCGATVKIYYDIKTEMALMNYRLQSIEAKINK